MTRFIYVTNSYLYVLGPHSFVTVIYRVCTVNKAVTSDDLRTNKSISRIYDLNLVYP